MKIQVLLVAVAGLVLVSASPPADPIPWEDEESLRDYPPCSRTVTDRCIQTNERGATRDQLADHDDGDFPGPARGGPMEEAGEAYAASDYPPCSRTVTDRCMQTNGRSSRAAATRMARSAPKQKHHARAMQMAMRAGERG
jgi:hypothetical protein